MDARSGKDLCTKNNLVAEAVDELQFFHSSGFLLVYPLKLWSFDAVTYTLHLERVKS